MRGLPLLLGALLLFSACSKEPSDSAPSPPNNATAAAHLQRDTTAPADRTSFGAELLPSPLLTSGRAEVVMHGCQETSSIRWEVNDTELPNQQDRLLSADHFQRGDKVRAIVSCGNNQISVSRKVDNSPPRVTRVLFQDPEITAGKDIVVIPTAEDPDGDEVSYSYRWSINGEPVTGVSDATLPGTYVHTGDEIALDVIPTDDLDQGEVFNGAIFTVPNAPPQITSKPPTAFKSLLYQYQVLANDPDGDELSYRLDEGPPGMILDPQAHQLSWPLDNVAPGTYTVSVVVEDSHGLQAQQKYTITLSAGETAH